ncbi:MAG: hypothetical protein M0T74_14700 [Desulfitobacterium hafniense]|nr:hypothetical protein [Desulfitobacterium hafniense]
MDNEKQILELLQSLASGQKQLQEDIGKINYRLENIDTRTAK